jgi:hypothetical protein
MATRSRRIAVPADDYDEPEMDDTTEELPVKRSSASSIGSGWGAPQQERRDTVTAPYLDIKKGKLLIKILEDEPSANFRQHFVQSTKSYHSCNEVVEDGRVTVRCPLCDAGHANTQNFRMNVVDMSEPTEVKVWTFGWLVAGILQGLSSDIPLSDPNRYFEVWRSKPRNGGAWAYTILPIKGRDLVADKETEPLTEGELDFLSTNLYGEETVWITADKKLREAADKLMEIDFKKN